MTHGLSTDDVERQEREDTVATPACFHAGSFDEEWTVHNSNARCAKRGEQHPSHTCPKGLLQSCTSTQSVAQAGSRFTQLLSVAFKLQ